MVAVLGALLDNIFAGYAVLRPGHKNPTCRPAQAVRTQLLGRSRTLLFSATQQPIHRFSQVIHRVFHSFFQYLGRQKRFLIKKTQDIDCPQLHCYYYIILIIFKIAVVVWGCGYVDKEPKALVFNKLRDFFSVDNFVNNFKSLWIKSLTLSAQVLLIACFFVQSRADASEILVNMNAIAKIESQGNPAAWNKKEDARGMYQLRKDVLTEWNNSHPEDSHSSDDLFKKEVNEKLARWYLGFRIPQMIKHFKKELSQRNVIIAYNAGIKYVKTGAELPETTKKYLSKYERIAA